MILEFERPIVDLERKIAELRGLSTDSVDFSSEITRLEQGSAEVHMGGVVVSKPLEHS